MVLRISVDKIEPPDFGIIARSSTVANATNSQPYEHQSPEMCQRLDVLFKGDLFPP